MVRRCSVNYCMGDLQSTIILGAWDPLVDAWPALVLHGSCKAKLSMYYAHGRAPFPIIMQCPSRCWLLAGRTGGLAGWRAGGLAGWLAGSLALLSWLAGRDATTGGRVELTLRRLILYQSRIVCVRVSLWVWGVHG